MLETGKRYKDNSGQAVTIGGRIKEYDAVERPWVWAIHGDWYHEETGQFVVSVRTRDLEIERSLLPTDNYRSISDHTSFIEHDFELNP